MGFISSLRVCEYSFWLFFIVLMLQFEVVYSISNINVENNLILGEQLLSKGHYSDALTYFHAAIEADPHYYLSYYKRATAYVALSKSKSAVRDLNKVVELNPGFLSARIQRGSIFIKQGKLEEAHIDFESVLRRNPHNQEALRHYNSIEPLKSQIRLARILVMNGGNFHEAIGILNKVLELCPWDPALYELRADCYILIGDTVNAIHDMKITTILRHDNTDAYYELSSLYYQIGEADEALKEIRECLKLDPEQKSCSTFYKKVKKVVEQTKLIKTLIARNRYKECVAKSIKMLEIENQTDPYIIRAKAFRCHCHLKVGDIPKALSICSQTLALEVSWPVLCDRAEANLAYELYNEAVSDYKRALEIDDDLRRAQDGLERAQNLLKRAQKKTDDYYGLLGVKKSDSKETIMKAYRQLASKWHPDKFLGKYRKIAATKFIDIANAKEVLTDPEKREAYDNRNTFP